ncbi:MAG TPA: carbamoyltransferase HypF [Candidatus Acidoferrum sp.]|nr:carbamoyltransferase HypF [Candidatus Acidoferrum sp.]
MTRARLVVKGIVQGVGFRPFVYRIATANRLVGFVRNLGDAGVEVVVEGTPHSISRFVTQLQTEQPPTSRIHQVDVTHPSETGEFNDFRILKSSEARVHAGSVIPPDIAICDNCLRELRTNRDRRHDYFFITCTDCGPRYTIIDALPYDRPRTTMRDFEMCKKCSNEYKDPSNRRFHAQTVACASCGPSVILVRREGSRVDSADPIREAGRLLERGCILAIKGNGGYHLASSTSLTEPIARLRKTKFRLQKPLAVMARDLETVRSFAEVAPVEAELMTSYVKPIVLLRKRSGFNLSEQIAPGLHNIGVMLPYTGLHNMLFDETSERAFVMTSANPPEEPIIKDDEEAFARLRDVVDYFLVHNRRISQRCDDSVVRFLDSTPTLLRRSRGYAPAPITVAVPKDACALGVGGELNVTSCLIYHGRAYMTQHIGDVETLQTFQFQKEATRHLLTLTGCKPNMVGRDLHPLFNTTKLAEELAQESSVRAVPVQHHHAHVAGLMAEHNVDEMVGICCDGYGYGEDGSAWGGEIILGDHNGHKRVRHLELQPMIGGDVATKYPLRMVAGILGDQPEVGDWLLERRQYFRHGEEEINMLLKQARSTQPMTTSCGRVLDAISAILDLCHERTYEGEPAMKLESAAFGGKDVLGIEPMLNGKAIETSPMIRWIFANLGRFSVRDLAYSAQSYLARSLGKSATIVANELGLKTIGFTGGVACNEAITGILRATVESEGLRFLVHQSVPPGDGGLSFGQAVVAAQSP